ncbi:hypothetical protein [Kurthia zopfii]|uniref:hypothetical protein n=1 Tax=Kurthia zopfii TaxID=1650 RepID=UPI000F6E7168|nr:hypothetical protein [Kurthia zopfii]VEI05123.1 Uncharacterised protein [Kurthia zopfii]
MVYIWAELKKVNEIENPISFTPTFDTEPKKAVEVEEDEDELEIEEEIELVDDFDTYDDVQDDKEDDELAGLVVVDEEIEEDLDLEIELDDEDLEDEDEEEEPIK